MGSSWKLHALVILIGYVLAFHVATSSPTPLDFVRLEPASCSGSIAECLVGGGEFEMDSESSRRILAIRTRYISYGALSRNTVPCSRRGASYYNCRPGAQANPYSRGCSRITRCRS